MGHDLKLVLFASIVKPSNKSPLHCILVNFYVKVTIISSISSNEIVRILLFVFQFILLVLSGFVPMLYRSLSIHNVLCTHRAQKLNCTNADHPDSYGHYREAKITAIKHHWWWKVSVSERASEWSIAS